MSRTKQPPSSAEIDAEIRRLTEQRAQAVAAEDQRRGQLLRGYLAGPHGAELRALLGRLANTRDAALFQPEGEPNPQEATRRKRTTAATVGAV